jgi:hypothetical protein
MGVFKLGSNTPEGDWAHTPLQVMKFRTSIKVNGGNIWVWFLTTHYPGYVGLGDKKKHLVVAMKDGMSIYQPINPHFVNEVADRYVVLGRFKTASTASTFFNAIAMCNRTLKETLEAAGWKVD